MMLLELQFWNMYIAPTELKLSPKWNDQSRATLIMQIVRPFWPLLRSESNNMMNNTVLVESYIHTEDRSLSVLSPNGVFVCCA